MLSCCCLRLRVHSLVGGLRKRGGHVAGRGARLAGRVRSFAARCAAACCRRRRIRANVAAWWSDKVVARALRRAWLAAALRVESRKADDGGILKLHEDVQMCGYEDVQVMWEMLRRTEMEPLAKQQRKRPFWRLSCSSSSSSSSSWSSCSRASSIEPHHHY